MGRFPQKAGRKGSQKWIQYYVNAASQELDKAIGLGRIDWRSPLASDDFAEYRDAAFLDVLGVSVKQRTLANFWPRGGPQWDALGLAETGECVLVEAKSHIPETFSPASAATGSSAELIRRSMKETKAALSAAVGIDWNQKFYQYANRLAHGYFLNELNRVQATIVFLYFVGDSEMRGPRSKEAWEAASTVIHEAMGIRGKIPSWVRNAYLEIPKH